MRIYPFLLLFTQNKFGLFCAYVNFYPFMVTLVYLILFTGQKKGCSNIIVTPGTTILYWFQGGLHHPYAHMFTHRPNTINTTIPILLKNVNNNQKRVDKSLNCPILVSLRAFFTQNWSKNLKWSRIITVITRIGGAGLLPRLK